jgi:hypothetical protein
MKFHIQSLMQPYNYEFFLYCFTTCFGHIGPSSGILLPKLPQCNLYIKGRAAAQTVSRWLPTPAARVRVLAACGVCGGQSGIGAGFLRVLRFPLPIIHQFLHHHNQPGLAQ